jgi:N-acetyl-gamma-glutamyl-phosphate reductase
LGDIDLTIKAGLDKVDFVFSALPHSENVAPIVAALEKGAKVVDLSADLRLNDAAEYQKWYKIAHPEPKYLKEAVYGLPELNRKQVAKARLVANPGCYPTSIILGMAPALKAGLPVKQVSRSQPASLVFKVPPRPPALCPGCPHRSVFYSLSKHKVLVSGDIGCYSLGAFLDSRFVYCPHKIPIMAV